MDAHSSPVRSPAHKIQRQKDHAGETTSTTEQDAAASVGAEPTARDFCTRTQRCHPTEVAMSARFTSAEERDPAGKDSIIKPLRATAEATDMLRVGHNAVYPSWEIHGSTC